MIHLHRLPTPISGRINNGRTYNIRAATLSQVNDNNNDDELNAVDALVQENEREQVGLLMLVCCVAQ